MPDNLQQTILKFDSLKTEPIQYMRPVVLVLAGQVRYRIHVEGEDASGDAIGKYSRQYLALRQRPPYNRDSSSKMIWSLTRQMEQDFVPVAENDVYGLGFNNKHNFDKATWLEEKLHPGVYNLSSSEINLVQETITDYINGLFD